MATANAGYRPKCATGVWLILDPHNLVASREAIAHLQTWKKILGPSFEYHVDDTPEVLKEIQDQLQETWNRFRTPHVTIASPFLLVGGKWVAWADQIEKLTRAGKDNPDILRSVLSWL